MEQNALELTTADVKMWVGKCILYSVTIAGNGADGDCQIYDGESDDDEEKLHLNVLSKTSHQSIFVRGVLMYRGIYVKRNADTTHVSVEFAPIED